MLGLNRPLTFHDEFSTALSHAGWVCSTACEDAGILGVNPLDDQNALVSLTEQVEVLAVGDLVALAEPRHLRQWVSGHDGLEDGLLTVLALHSGDRLGKLGGFHVLVRFHLWLARQG